MSDFDLSGVLSVCGAWTLLALVSGVMFVKTHNLNRVMHVLLAVTFLFTFENALFSIAESYPVLYAAHLFPATFPEQLPSILRNDTLTGFGFIGAFLLLLVTHRSLGLFTDNPARAVQTTTPSSPPGDDLSGRLAMLELGEKIERLYTLGLAPELLLRSALEQIANHPGIPALWCGMKNDKGEIVPVFVADANNPSFFDEAYGVTRIVSPSEAANPSEYAFCTQTPHLFADALDAPMHKHYFNRLTLAPPHSILSVPLYYPDSSRADGVLTLLTAVIVDDTSAILEYFDALMHRVLQNVEHSRAHLELIANVKRLESSETLFRNIISSLPVRLYWKNDKLVYEGCNTLFAVDADEQHCENIVGKTDRHLVWSEYAESLEMNDLKVINSGQEQTNQLEKQHNLWRLSNRAPLKDASGNTVGVIGAYIDFTLQQRAFDYHEQREQRLHFLLDQMPTVAVQGFDAQRNITYWNRQSEVLYGYTAEEVLGRPFETLLLPASEQKTFIAEVSNWLHHDEKMAPLVHNHLHKHGHTLTIKTARILLGRTGDAPQFYSIDVDLTRQKEAESKLQKLADYDALTHLPNRHYLNRHLVELISKAERHKDKFAIFFIDLDDFKYINDTYGHHYGDELLIETSTRLKSVLREYDFIARFGGDEFIVTLEYGQEEFATSRIAEKMIHVLESPFSIHEKDLYVTASIGISLYPENSYQIDSLLRQADTAMYKAKNMGKNRYAYFSEELTTEMSEQLLLETALRKSFREERIHFVFQPQVDLQTRQIVSCEALARWINPETRQYVPTGTFLPIIERINLMPELTRRAIDAALALLVRWRDLEIPLLRVDINVTSSMLADEAIFTYLKTRLEADMIDPQQIGIEITETQLIELNDPVSAGVLKSLDDYGIHISIDDFGTGYSSLSYLSRLTVDTVKIDKSFIDEASDPRNQAVIRSIIAMSHELGYDVIAEGVERDEQVELLGQLQCDKIQGNLFYRPLHEDAFTEARYIETKASQKVTVKS